MAHLELQYPDGRTAMCPLRLPETVLGRDSSCDIALKDAIASRRHARIRKDEEGRFWLEDLRSKNGVSLNNRAVTLAQIRHGDCIGIGTCQLTLFAEPAQHSVHLDDTPRETQVGATSAWRADQRFDLSGRRLETLYRLNERLTGHFDRDDLLGELLNVCVEQLRFERAGVAVWAGKPHQPEWLHLRNLSSDPGGEFRISRSVVDRALEHGERTLVNDTADGEIDPTASMISNNILSAMCVPMEYLSQVHGVIYGDRVTSTGGYTKEDIDFLAALGRLGAMGLANVELFEERQRMQRVELQLRLARDIQSQLFPNEPIELEGITIDALNHPGQKVSGDYYDFFQRDDGRIAIIIADVAGKGVPASLLMANLQAAVRIMLMESTDLVAAVSSINRLVCVNISDARFITAIFGLLEPKSRHLSFVNAGHPGPYLLRSGLPPEPIVVPPGLPVGIEPDEEYRLQDVELPAGPASLVFYTDGVPDAENEQGEQYQMERFVSVLGANPDAAPHELVTRIRRSIKQFTRNHPQTDDITMLVLRSEPPS